MLSVDEGEVDKQDLQGRCTVLDQPSADFQEADVFFCRDRLLPGPGGGHQPLRRPISQCHVCWARTKAGRSDLEEFQAMGGLPSADLYSGGGGTITGKKGWFRSVLAVDFDAVACETLE